MKRVFGTYLLSAGLLLLAVPVATLAQNNKNLAKDGAAMEKEKASADKASVRWKEAKAKGDKEAERIIITRNGGDNEKTIIEINGDAVIVNGKNVKELKGEVSVERHRVRDVDAFMAPLSATAPLAPRIDNFKFDLNADGMNFFSEDTSRAMLGAMTAEDERGARINSISKESGAEKAGLKAGDVITKIGDVKIEDADDVTTEVRRHKPGDKVGITYLRDGKEQKTTAELSKWKGLRINANTDNFRVMVPGRVTPFGPNQNFREFNMDYTTSRPRLGLSIQDTEDGKGVSVKEVEEESAAAKAGIKEGDIITHFNDEAVNDVTEMRRELAENRDKLANKVMLLRNGKEQTVEIRTPRKLKTADL